MFAVSHCRVNMVFPDVLESLGYPVSRRAGSGAGGADGHA